MATPLELYIELLNNWAEAVEALIRSFSPDNQSEFDRVTQEKAAYLDRFKRSLGKDINDQSKLLGNLPINLVPNTIYQVVCNGELNMKIAVIDEDRVGIFMFKPVQNNYFGSIEKATKLLTSLQSAAIGCGLDWKLIVISRLTGMFEGDDVASCLPLLMSHTGGAHEPLCEAIICSSISGRSDYKNDMPASLELVRVLEDGSEISRRYVQEET